MFSVKVTCDAKDDLLALLKWSKPVPGIKVDDWEEFLYDKMFAKEEAPPRKHNYPPHRRPPSGQRPATADKPRTHPVKFVQPAAPNGGEAPIPIGLHAVEGSIMDALLVHEAATTHKPFVIAQVRAAILAKGVKPKALGGALTSLLRKGLLEGGQGTYRLPEGVTNVTGASE